MTSIVHYTVFDPATGEILRSGTCPADMLRLQAGSGEAVIEGDADDQAEMVVDGHICLRPARC
jgi:hypothetical protein